MHAKVQYDHSCRPPSNLRGHRCPALLLRKGAPKELLQCPSHSRPSGFFTLLQLCTSGLLPRFLTFRLRILLRYSYSATLNLSRAASSGLTYSLILPIFCCCKIRISTKQAEFTRAIMSPNRSIGVALDYSASSKYALQWAVDNVLREHDQLVVLVANKEIDEDSGHYQLFGKNGSPLIPLQEEEDAGTQRQYNLKNDEEVRSTLKEAASVKKATVVFKVYWGEPKENICKAVADIPLDFLIMGCRGLSALKRSIMGSVSDYVSNNATCPVTIVKLSPNLPA